MAEDKATDLAASFTTALTTIGTGALVFSIGLASTASAFSGTSRVLLVLSWVVLTISVVAGLLAQSTIAMHVVNTQSIFTSKIFEIPSRVQQLAFLLSIGILAYVLVNQIWAKPDPGKAIAATPGQALSMLMRCAAVQPVSISSVKLVSLEQLGSPLWQFTVQRGTSTTEDIFVNANDGRMIDIQYPERVQPACLAVR